MVAVTDRGGGSGGGSSGGDGSGGDGSGGDGDGQWLGVTAVVQAAVALVGAAVLVMSAVDGEGGGLNQPEKGNFDEAIAEYDQKITDTLAEIKDQSGQFGSLIEQKLAIQLNSGNAPLALF